MGFFKNVHHIVSLIPEGRVMCYTDIAEAMGKPNSGNMVGIAMKFCPGSLPWHRVVNDQGRIITGRLQIMVLQKEGVPFMGVESTFVNVDRCRFTPQEMRALLRREE